MLNRGYYLWRVGGIDSWELTDGNVIDANPGLNAGTAGVQYFFSQLDDVINWQYDVSQDGFFNTFRMMFGYPFDLAIEPLIPSPLEQPVMRLPFQDGETWSFTSGPHGGWDSGSGWAGLDFAPPGEETGCVQSDHWVTALADGLIVRSANGSVVQDLNGDGYEQTGWVVLYMHIESRERVSQGTFLAAGAKIGHPSCEGGLSNGTHVHIARRYNGEWIPADGPVPYILDDWVSSGTGIEYDGFMQRGDIIIEAYDGNETYNQIYR